MTSRNLKTALSYAKLNLAVLPVYGLKDHHCTCANGKDCTRPGKHPLTKNGVKDATTDPKKIRAWWKASPTANIAIATGTASGVLVLDLDPRNGGDATLKDAQRKYGALPSTATALTGGNGKHFLFAYPKKPLRSDTGGKVFGLGLDVLSDGHYFIAPGSMGVKRSYVWAAGKSVRDLKPVSLPASWRAALSKKARTEGSAAPIRDAIPEGGRNNELTKHAGTLRRGGLSKDAILAALIAQNKICSPPLPKSEVQAIVDSVCGLYPEGIPPTDAASHLANGVLANHFSEGRHLMVEQGRFWTYEKTHWVRVSDDWVKGRVLQTIQAFHIKAGASTASLLGQALDILRAQLSEIQPRLTGPADDKAVINVQNGELWLTDDGSVELRPHRPGSYLTHCLDIVYDPRATCPNYDKALAGIFSKARKPKGMVRHWHELTGYILQPVRNIPLIVVGLGGGSNGKTKLIGTIIKLMGDHMVCAQQIGSFDGNRFAMASLFGKLLLLDDDVNSNTRLPDGFLKTVSEGKVVTAEEKHKPSFNFRVRTVPMMLCNHVPSLVDLTHGMQRRLMVLPFDKKFVGEEKDAALFDRIWAKELPGVLNRALVGLKRLRQRGSGFLLPRDIKAATRKFMGDANPLPAFIKEGCVKETGSSIGITEFYNRYKLWCEDGGITMKQQLLKVRKNLENLGFKFGRNNQKRKVMGLRLR